MLFYVQRIKRVSLQGTSPYSDAEDNLIQARNFDADKPAKLNGFAQIFEPLDGPL